jgi:hypothetical protein
MRSFTAFRAALGLAITLLVAACEWGTGETRTLTRSVDLDKAESVDVELRMGAGELNVGGGSAKLIDASFRFNTSAEPLVDYQGGARGSLRVQQPEGSSWGNVENNWDLRLNDSVPMDLRARLGAGEATLNLGTLDLRSLEVQQGAGEVRLDLRGTPKRSYDVRVSGGVGSTRIRVPRSVAVVANATSGIGSIRVDGLEKRGSSWYNPGHESDPVTIRLDVKGGVGEIVISAE